MKQRLLEQNVIYADENLVMVLKENGKSATSESRMCVGGEQSKMPVWIFEYQPDRNGKRQESSLEGLQSPLCRIQPGAENDSLRMLGAYETEMAGSNAGGATIKTSKGAVGF